MWAFHSAGKNRLDRIFIVAYCSAISLSLRPELRYMLRPSNSNSDEPNQQYEPVETGHFFFCLYFRCHACTAYSENNIGELIGKNRILVYFLNEPRYKSYLQHGLVLWWLMISVIRRYFPSVSSVFTSSNCPVLHNEWHPVMKLIQFRPPRKGCLKSPLPPGGYQSNSRDYII